MTTKLALCLERADAPVAFNMAKDLRAIPMTELHELDQRALWNVPARLIDRAICETDPSTLQFIPYVVLTDEDDRVFCYCRGKGGAEARLQGALSIGLGGHVDEQKPPELDLERWLKLEALRELEEEVGLTSAMSDDIDFCALLVDPTDGVGRVHMGLLAILPVARRDLGAAELGVIEGGQWLSLPELCAAETFDRMEGYSKAAIRYMASAAFSQ